MLGARSTLGDIAFVRPNPTSAPFAWANIDGLNDTPLLRDSENVSSITDNAAGDYTIVYVIGAFDTNYVVIGGASRNAATNNCLVTINNTGGQTAGSVRILTINTDVGTSEVPFVHVVCIGVA